MHKIMNALSNFMILVSNGDIAILQLDHLGSSSGHSFQCHTVIEFLVTCWLSGNS